MEKNHYSRTSVAIIGGGLSGSLLAMKLLKQTKIPLQIFLIESAKKRYGRGIAYSPNSIYQKLNVTAKNMSLFEENPMHFYDWWKSKRRDYFYLKENFDENSFFPRFIYGDYLEANLNLYANQKPDFVDFLPINDEAVDATLEASRWSITLASGTILHVQLLVLATGNIPPANPSYLTREVLENKRYQDNPWNDSLFETINANDDIGILGSGLSMVDVLMTLKRKDFHGQIVSFSRSGKFPLVHEAPTEQKPTSFPILDGTLRKDLKKFREWMSLNKEVSSANLISEVRPHISKIWQSWNTKDQLRFLRHVRPFWESFRHRIPKESMEMISDWVNSGKLKFIRARIQKITLKDETLNVTINSPRDQNPPFKFDRLINCTGPDTQLKESKNKLYANLFNKGYIQNAQNRIGFKTVSGGQIVGKDGMSVENLYAVGPLRKNELWESTALREIRAQVDELVINIQSIAYNESQIKKTKFDKICNDVLELIPDSNAIPNLNRILSLYSSQEMIQTIAGTLGWIRPESGYSRLRIMTEPFELLMLFWAPLAETAIHKHVGFGGNLLVLEGSLLEKKFEVRDGKIIPTEEMILNQGQSVMEVIDGIHQVKNSSLDTYAVSLHLYHPVINSLTSMEIYDLINNRVGILNEKATSVSWNEKGSSFQSIRNIS